MEETHLSNTSLNVACISPLCSEEAGLSCVLQMAQGDIQLTYLMVGWTALQTTFQCSQSSRFQQDEKIAMEKSYLDKRSNNDHICCLSQQ